MPEPRPPTSALAARRRLAERFVGGLGVVLCLFLGWQIIAEAQGARLAKAAPAEALAWQPANALALARLAELHLASATVHRPSDTAESLARRSLAVSPLQITAIRVLALAAERDGDNARALALMKIAGDRSQRDARSHLWLLRNRLLARDFDAAYSHGVALMRNSATRRRAAAEIAFSVGSGAGAVEALTARLVRQPNLRPPLLPQIAEYQGPDMLLTMLLDIKKAGSVITDAESALVTQLLLADKRPQQAYLAWILLLPETGYEDLGSIYDGGFEGLPGKGPFAWSLDNKGFNRIRAAPSRPGHALHVIHNRQSRPLHASQTMVLPSGRYRLSVDVFLDAVDGGRLWWRVACNNSRQDLATLEVPPEVRLWLPISRDFVVPADCPVQTLELIGGEGGLSGQIEGWFDQIAIRPVAGGSGG